MSEEQSTYSANPGKQLVRTVDGVDYQRIPVKTHLITNTDDMADVVVRCAKDRMQEGDILFISEKAVACTQSRAIPMEDIRPRKLAVTLSRYVTKTPAGIGLGIPETMEMALQECGTLRILFAAFCSVIGKLLRRKGWFYIVAGPKARGIDGPTEGTIPPYDHYVVLTPWVPPAGWPRLWATRWQSWTSTTWGPTSWAAPRRSPPWPCWPGSWGTTPWVSPVSAPQWASSAKYDIRARAPEGILRGAAFYSLFVLNSFISFMNLCKN